MKSFAFQASLCLLVGLASATPLATTTTSSAGSSISPNPIKNMYPNDITGVQNSTFGVLPISLAEAQKMIPPQYKILTSAYEHLLPDFPNGSYPVVLQTTVDHDINTAVGPNPDIQQFQILLPFVDLLGDGYSSFVYKPYIFLDGTEVVDILGTFALYGITVIPAFFQPAGEPYSFTDPSNDAISIAAYTNSSSSPTGSLLGKAQYSIQDQTSPYPVSFFKNVTNQPLFRDGLICGNLITLFNTTLTQGGNEPVPISGTVDISRPYLGEQTHFEDVKGYKMTVVIIERMNSCEALKGYAGTGSGD